MFFYFDQPLRVANLLFFLLFLQRLVIRLDNNCVKLYVKLSYVPTHADFFLLWPKLSDSNSRF